MVREYQMPPKSALLVIDVQKGLFEGPYPPYRGARLIETINELISKARSADTPILFIQHNQEGEESLLHPHSEGWSLHNDLHTDEKDINIQKIHPDSFQETKLQSELESLGVEKLFIVGLQTEYCIDTTCRRAYSLGYEVVLIENGHSTYDTECLSAEQIVDHHNQVLGGWFVTLKKSSEVFNP
jgi:nicotinamidase-related amidase